MWPGALPQTPLGNSQHSPDLLAVRGKERKGRESSGREEPKLILATALDNKVCLLSHSQSAIVRPVTLSPFD